MQHFPNKSKGAPWLTTGIGAASATWIAAYFLHLPGLDLSGWLQVSVMALVMYSALALGGRLDATGSLWTGAKAGLTTGLINLMLLGSVIVEQPQTTAEMEQAANRPAPEAAGIVLGSLAFSAVLGMVAWAVGRNRHARRTADPARWHARLALISAVTFLPLLAVGGVVTSTESGMAVPDAVTSYGAVSFLFPFSLMNEPRIYFEHVHRLFGSLVGLLTMIVMIRTFFVSRRSALKVFAVAVFLGVCWQGVMGIIRVDDNLAWMGAIHGVFAQIVFGAAVMLAVALWPLRSETRDAMPRGGTTWANAALVCLLIQLTFGALYRHLGAPHALWSHVGFSVVVAGVCAILGMIATTTEGRTAAAVASRRLGVALVAVVIWQFLLGWAALFLVMDADPRQVPLADELATAPPAPVAEALVATIHQVSGASLLGLAAATRAVFGRLGPAVKRSAPKTDDGFQARAERAFG